MPTWTITLPEPATEGSPTHLQDHDALTQAVSEVRKVLEALEALAEGKADAEHQHDAGDVATGTFSTGRIPVLSFGKVNGLQAALDAKAEKTITDDHEARIAALEAAGGA